MDFSVLASIKVGRSWEITRRSVPPIQIAVLRPSTSDKSTGRKVAAVACLFGTAVNSEGALELG